MEELSEENQVDIRREIRFQSLSLAISTLVEEVNIHLGYDNW